MVFVLSMSLFGLSNIMLELIPDIQVGWVDIPISNMIFIPLTMAVLFSPFWAALGAPLGEIVFTDLLMGDFSGLAEVEGYLQMFLGIYIGGSLVRRVTSVRQIWIGALVIIGIDKLLSAVVDLSKVWIGVEDAITSRPPGVDPGRRGCRLRHRPGDQRHPVRCDPRRVDHPRLHGRIEPLMGIRPRRLVSVSDRPVERGLVAVAVLLSVASFDSPSSRRSTSAPANGAGLPRRMQQRCPVVSVAAVAVLALAVLLFRVSQKKSGRVGRSELHPDHRPVLPLRARRWIPCATWSHDRKGDFVAVVGGNGSEKPPCARPTA